MDNSRKSERLVSRSALQDILAAKHPQERERLLHIHWQLLREQKQAKFSPELFKQT